MSARPGLWRGSCDITIPTPINKYGIHGYNSGMIDSNAPIAPGGPASRPACSMGSSTVLIFALFAALPFWKPEVSTNINDFVAYWSAASRIVHGQNPYAIGPVLELERAVGFTGSAPLIMRNPPWTLSIIAPLGFFTFVTAQRIWLIAAFFEILVSLKWLWDVYRVPGQSGFLTSVAIAAFSPIAVAITIGQISPLVLLGIAGFLRFEQKRRLGLAGVFLVLAALKPHLVFLLWATLLLFSLCRRSAKTLGMFALTVGIGSFIAVLFDRSIFTEYVNFMTREGVVQEVTPTLGGALRLWLRTYAVQFVPAMLALGWLLYYASRKIRQSKWSWKEQTPLLLMVSLLTTPYAWFFDQVLLVPCILQSIARLRTLRHGRLRNSIAGLYLGANVLAVVLIVFQRPGFWYTWTIPFWFTLFTLAWIQPARELVKTSAGVPGS